jgi:hypothetical protein
MEEEGIADQPLKWGVTKESSQNIAGHCSFSDGDVKKPTVGFLKLDYGRHIPILF